jgi:amidophosphoribosyltransferase
VYQDLDALVDAVHHENAEIESFDTSCFSGHYVTGNVGKDYLNGLEALRSNAVKARRDARVRSEEMQDNSFTETGEF